MAILGPGLATCLAEPPAPVVRQLAAGTRFATPCYVLDSGRPGPTVLVVGGVHGDEPAGSAAAERVCRWPIVRGRLLVLPRAHEPALKAGQRRAPEMDEALSDLNRDFPKTGQKPMPRGPLAIEIWQLVQHEKVTWLVDLHESQNYRQLKAGSVGNSILFCPMPEVNKLLPVLLAAVNGTIDDPAKKFAYARPPADGSLARAAAQHLGINSVLFESTRKDPLDVRIREHCTLVQRLLTQLGMIDSAAKVEK